ncbi:MAG: glycosyltransferase family 4 protein [Verrucomicrobiota bacterium]
MEKPLTIFHTECGLQWGGQELRTLEEVDRARADGYAAWALVNEHGRMAEHAERRGTPHYRLSLRKSVDARGFAQLARLVARHRPDVICSHNARDFYLAWPFRALGIPVLRYRHISDPVKATWSRSFAYRRGASRVVATAEFIKRQLVEVNGVAPERISVIGEGVDLTAHHQGIDGAAARAEFGLGPEHFVVGTVGMVRSDKGFYVLVRAAARLKEELPQLRFLLVGGPTRDGAHLRQCQREAEELGVTDRLIWTGWREDVPALMAAMDLFVLASVGVEGQSRVIPEAFALGKPVIGSRVGGIPELVEDGVTGLLVDKDDPAALATAIARMAREEGLRESCAAAGLALARERLDINRRMSESYALYRSLL